MLKLQRKLLEFPNMICINPSKRMVKAIKLSVMIYALKYENISFSTAAIFQFLSVCNPVEYGFSY